MMKSGWLRWGAVCGLCGMLFLAGCRSKPRKSASAPNSPAYADQLHALVNQKQLPMLRWPNYSDLQGEVKAFYDARNFEVAWTRNGAPTTSALAFMQDFRDAANKGLNPMDYDTALWEARVGKLSIRDHDATAQFDVAMTINVMRYISDLRVGRVNPQHFNFEINVQQKKYKLSDFVSDQAVDATDVPKLIAGVEPNSEEYRKTIHALAQYLDLAKKQEGDPEYRKLPTVAKSVGLSDAYPAVERLWTRLQLEGDAPATDEAPTKFNQAVSDAVKSYQKRHGLSSDGKLGAGTIKSLNVPMSVRVTQLGDSLERWRWLPDQYLNARLMVNLPEFVLRGFTPEHTLDFTMRVVIGKVVDEHKTPVFTHVMKYLIFRPYWNVPVDIAKKELVPHMEANPDYLESKNYEVINRRGVVQTTYNVKSVEHGGYMVRERPGPQNSLGLVKFMFPNQYDIYLHSTPATALFARERRDFSHGCVRVQHPDELAAWVLQGQKDKDQQEWDLEKVQEAMNDGQDSYQVNLKTQLPIVIFYLTAHVDEDGAVDFFDDIYDYDAEMEAVFKKGPPYPSAPEPVKPATKPGDTV